MTSPSDAEGSDPLAGFDRMKHSRQTKRTGAVAFPHVRVTGDGRTLVVYPDDETIRAWNEEGWSVVAVAVARNRSELALTKSTDGCGIGIRRYRHQRVCVPAGISRLGRARQREPLGGCTVRRVGDCFIFKIAEQVIIEPV